VSYLYQTSYYSYLIKVGLALGEDAGIGLAFFNLCLLGCQSLRETLLQKELSFYIMSGADAINISGLLV
jgi:hypothetical protein